jgi:hypothetical protein
MFTHAHIQEYFRAEKWKGVILIFLGGAGFVLSLFLFTGQSPFFQGLAVPIGLIGVSQVIMGYAIYNGNAKRLDEHSDAQIDYKELRNEVIRMQHEMRTVSVYRMVEIAFIIVGLFLIYLYRADPDHEFLYGFGLALASYVFVMFCVDYFTEMRGRAHVHKINEFLKQPHH